ncbi:MAG TPA: sigma-70 family RNA polymerase sigma factor, partial [Vicinamibacterales bacterium]|nr:sigma-70 family RNA polymerase sigma factor [Vicinamibacterales bacterium]
MRTRAALRRNETADTRPDTELIVGMQAASGEALAALFRRYARLVHRVAADILRDAGEAEDVTQEVFLEIFRKAGQYDASRGSVRVWLLQYAYHRALRRKTALKTRAAYAGAPLDEVRDDPTVERRRLTRDECRWVISAGLASLPEMHRRTLELACFQQLPLRDIAEHLGVSVGCTRHYYYRGLARLRAWAQRLMDESPACPLPRRSRRSKRGTKIVAAHQPIHLMPRETER